APQRRIGSRRCRSAPLQVNGGPLRKSRADAAKYSQLVVADLRTRAFRSGREPRGGGSAPIGRASSSRLFCAARLGKHRRLFQTIPAIERRRLASVGRSSPVVEFTRPASGAAGDSYKDKTPGEPLNRPRALS